VSAERHAGPAVNPPVARSSHEAHLYMDLTACECGETRFPRASAVVTLPGGELASRYTGVCAGCGRPREFVFRLAEDAAPGDRIRYGGDQPSELIDAGEWLWIADRYARSVPAAPHRLPDPERGRARTRLSGAAAAIDEVLKFAPPQAALVPPAAIWTALGRSVYEREPGRFRVGRLNAVRSAYREALERFA
jgi:hypothetical protein